MRACDARADAVPRRAARRHVARVALLAALLLGTVAMPATTRADGGLVRARTEADGLALTLLTSPTPLRVGVADVSALVQDERGVPVLDAEVELRIEDLEGGHPAMTAALTRDAATNKLLQAALLELHAPGRFRLTASARRGEAQVVASADVDVAPPASAARTRAFPLALPPIAVALYAVHQALRRRARRAPELARGGAA